MNPPWTSGRLPEMSPKISSKTYHFLPKFKKSPSSELRIFLYILYIFDKPPWDERKISPMPFWILSHVWKQEINFLQGNKYPHHLGVSPRCRVQTSPLMEQSETPVKRCTVVYAQWNLATVQILFWHETRNLSKVHGCRCLAPWVNNWPISNLLTFTNIFISNFNTPL